MHHSMGFYIVNLNFIVKFKSEQIRYYSCKLTNKNKINQTLSFLKFSLNSPFYVHQH